MAVAAHQRALTLAALFCALMPPPAFAQVSTGVSASYPADIRAGAGFKIQKQGLSLRISADYSNVPLLTNAPAAGNVLVQDPTTGEFNRLDLSKLPTTVPQDGSVTLQKFSAIPAFSFIGNVSNVAAQAQYLGPAQAKTALALDQVNNTSDANKPVSAPQAAALNALADQALNVRSFGAKDDDATDNTAAIQNAINVASATARTLSLTPSAGGTGKFRVGPGLDFKDVNFWLEEGAGLVNLDGGFYTGAWYTGSASLPGVIDPYRIKNGRRVRSPNGDWMFTNKVSTNKVNDLIYNGFTAYPYSVNENEQNYFLGGQIAPSSGSWAGKTIYANLYNYSNGPGIIITCDAVTNSQFIGNCTPSPTATNPAHGLPNVFNPSRITQADGNGVPPNTYAGSWDAGTIRLATGPNSDNVGFTGPSGRYQFRVVSGRSEFNPLSLNVGVVGTAANGGPQGGMNFYNEATLRTSASPSPVDQEGAAFGWMINVTKQAPGNLNDRLHNGSAGIAIMALPDNVTGTNTSYPMDAGVSVTGWSGPPTLGGGQDPGATYAALAGVKVGGGCLGVHCFATQKSKFKIGVDVQTYDTAINISSPNSGTIARAITVAAGAGNSGFGTLTPGSMLSATAPSQDASQIAGAGNGGIAQMTTGTGADNDNKLAFGVVDGAYAWQQALRPGSNLLSLVLQPLGGNVGIGNTAPAAALDVNGTVRATGLNLNWSGTNGTCTIAGYVPVTVNGQPKNLPFCN